MPAVGLAAVLAALYLVLDPPSADLAAHLYRAGLVDRAGITAWDNAWYGGHHLPAYSVLFPGLGSLIGVRLLGALSLVGATAAFARLAADELDPRAARLARPWFAVAMAAAVASGRLPFAFGIALGTCAVLAAARGRVVVAGLLGAATTMGSPVAGLFVVLIAAAWVGTTRPRPHAALAMGAAAALTGIVLVGAFPEGGDEPFVGSSFWPALAATGLALAIARDGPRPLRAGLVLYALLLVAAFAVHNPLGGNAARLGGLLGGPLAAALLMPDRRRLLAFAALPLAYWTMYPPVHDWTSSAGDPAIEAGYYAPLLAEIARRDAHAPPARVEIPFTASHWEALHVAAHVPLARGWERQLDRRHNRLFYEGTLTPERYRAWLDGLAVRWVALPDAKLDPSARGEARLIRARPDYLREVWRSPHWRLFAVQRPTPLGAASLTADGFTARSGLVRVRWTPYWAVLEGRGCVARADGDWTEIESDEPGATLRVGVRVGPLRALGRDRDCR